MSKKWNLIFTSLMIGLLMAGVVLAANISDDLPDSSAYVGYGWNGYLPAFKYRSCQPASCPPSVTKATFMSTNLPMQKSNRLGKN
jgi:hypothetical protein